MGWGQRKRQTVKDGIGGGISRRGRRGPYLKKNRRKYRFITPPSNRGGVELKLQFACL